MRRRDREHLARLEAAVTAHAAMVEANTAAMTALGTGLGKLAEVMADGIAQRPEIAAATARTDVYGLPAALGAAAACFLIRYAGIRCNINAPIAREAKTKE
jgi:hypothetical protein